jgi:hypothetical protein
LRTLNLSGNEANIRESQDENDEAYAVEQGRLEAELTSLSEAEAMRSTQAGGSAAPRPAGGVGSGTTGTTESLGAARVSVH